MYLTFIQLLLTLLLESDVSHIDSSNLQKLLVLKMIYMSIVLYGPSLALNAELTFCCHMPLLASS
ncbi:hypothetical protein CHS0354_005638 [Potamilus streckersoni]|uniref:Uncharacterized protein n=1 Tax=Potamilus streckersoni TaxID=2493646 RepID=A0AAE0S0R9_9BIVA|nr:hypothetical protein CHS0354_005638 [Potamilus streckersoni]